MQIKNDKTPSTHFERIKLCAFIFAVLRNDNDCITIDIPLKDISAQIAGVFGITVLDNSFAPRVTSTMPYRKHLISESVAPHLETKG